jgi:soluble lytic murein transglycosylase
MKSILALLLFLLSHVAHASTTSGLAESCVQRYSARYGIPPELIASLIDVESAWNPHATSNKGAMGLMQLMPETARRFGAFDPYDIEQNIAAGTRYVTSLMWEFRGDLRLVSAAYYAGDHWVAQKQLNYRNPDVVAYVQAVRNHYMARKYGASWSIRRQQR